MESVIGMKKRIEENENSIIFNCVGAIDFIEQINIELSLVDKEGFIEMHPFLLRKKLNEIYHIQNILDTYFFKIVKRVPRFSDTNEDLPLERRFTKVFYKCYKKFRHSHQPYGEYEYTDLTLDDSIEYIKAENFGIMIPIITNFLK